MDDLFQSTETIEITVDRTAAKITRKTEKNTKRANHEFVMKYDIFSEWVAAESAIQITTE